ncbi:MAG: flavodoxin [Phascolarctobacterium sp.]|nr:flavodoxin [Phascolarctobacterium sp.]
MKLFKILALSTALISMFCVGCGGNDKKAAAPAPAKAQATEAPKVTNDKALVVYFSQSGNTQKVANMIQKQTGAAMFRVETVKTYASNYHALIDEAKKEQQANARPELKKAKVDNLKQYDTVFVGYPNWWGTLPMPLFTFFEANDMTGKNIVPFVTHEGSAFGTSLNDLAKLAPKANIKEGIDIRGGRVGDSEADVTAWLKKGGYVK